MTLGELHSHTDALLRTRAGMKCPPIPDFAVIAQDALIELCYRADVKMLTTDDPEADILRTLGASSYLRTPSALSDENSVVEIDDLLIAPLSNMICAALSRDGANFSIFTQRADRLINAYNFSLYQEG